MLGGTANRPFSYRSFHVPRNPDGYARLRLFFYLRDDDARLHGFLLAHAEKPGVKDVGKEGGHESRAQRCGGDHQASWEVTMFLTVKQAAAFACVSQSLIYALL